ncbi:MAG: hypothetical protein WC798_02805 [Candidatus Paceibacterota bacterium]
MNQMIEVDALADVHTHLREGELIAPLIVNAIAGGADVLGAMPNTKKGLRTEQEVSKYVNGLTQAGHQQFFVSGKGVSFIPSVLITEETTKKDIDECVKAGIRDGKVYPFLRTTNALYGVKHYGRILPIVKHCGKVGMRVHFHPEHPSMIFNNRDAEFAFLPIARIFLEETDAIIIWEHGTDARCIPHWENMALTGRFALTLTAHHLATNEDLSFGDVRSVCKPPVKTEDDRRGLIDLVAKDYSWVMAGGDSAFHDKSAKQVEEGTCACGAYTGPFLMPLYAHALDKIIATENGIQTFVNFTSRNARRLYLLPESSRTLTLVRGESWYVPRSYRIGTQTALPFGVGQYVGWKLVD